LKEEKKKKKTRDLFDEQYNKERIPSLGVFQESSFVGVASP
jgi:hypothetical protein